MFLTKPLKSFLPKLAKEQQKQHSAYVRWSDTCRLPPPKYSDTIQTLDKSENVVI